MAGLFVTEKGFCGKDNSRGAATVVCGSKGEPLPLQLVVLQNDAVGGRCLIIHDDKIVDKKRKSHMIMDGMIYEISVDRKNIAGGNITVKKYEISDPSGNRNLEITKMETAYFSTDGGNIRFVSSFGMQNSEEATKLLENDLWDAFAACLRRSFDQSPHNIYWGVIAQDASPIKKEWAKKVEQKQNV